MLGLNSFQLNPLFHCCCWWNGCFISSSGVLGITSICASRVVNFAKWVYIFAVVSSIVQHNNSKRNRSTSNQYTLLVSFAWRLCRGNVTRIWKHVRDMLYCTCLGSLDIIKEQLHRMNHIKETAICSCLCAKTFNKRSWSSKHIKELSIKPSWIPHLRSPCSQGI